MARNAGVECRHHGKHPIYPRDAYEKIFARDCGKEGCEFSTHGMCFHRKVLPVCNCDMPQTSMRAAQQALALANMERRLEELTRTIRAPVVVEEEDAASTEPVPPVAAGRLLADVKPATEDFLRSLQVSLEMLEGLFNSNPKLRAQKWREIGVLQPKKQALKSWLHSLRSAKGLAHSIKSRSRELLEALEGGVLVL